MISAEPVRADNDYFDDITIRHPLIRTGAATEKFAVLVGGVLMKSKNIPITVWPLCAPGAAAREVHCYASQHRYDFVDGS